MLLPARGRPCPAPGAGGTRPVQKRRWPGLSSGGGGGATLTRDFAVPVPPVPPVTEAGHLTRVQWPRGLAGRVLGVCPRRRGQMPGGAGGGPSGTGCCPGPGPGCVPPERVGTEPGQRCPEHLSLDLEPHLMRVSGRTLCGHFWNRLDWGAGPEAARQGAQTQGCRWEAAVQSDPIQTAGRRGGRGLATLLPSVPGSMGRGRTFQSGRREACWAETLRAKAAGALLPSLRT